MTTPQELLQPLIIACRTPAQYRTLASELEHIAALARNYADAQQRQQTKPPEDRVSPKRGKGVRPSTPRFSSIDAICSAEYNLGGSSDECERATGQRQRLSRAAALDQHERRVIAEDTRAELRVARAQRKSGIVT